MNTGVKIYWCDRLINCRQFPGESSQLVTDCGRQRLVAPPGDGLVLVAERVRYDGAGFGTGPENS